MTLCPQLPAAVSFHLSAQPGARGPPRGVSGWRPCPPIRELAGLGRKPSSLPRGSGRGSRRLSCPWQDRTLTLAAGRLPGACPVLQRVTAQGGCGGPQPSCPFWLLDHENVCWERLGMRTRMGGCGGCSQWAQRPQGPTADLLPEPQPPSALALPTSPAQPPARHLAQDSGITLGVL